MHTAAYNENVACDSRRRKNVPRHILFWSYNVESSASTCACTMVEV